MAIADVPIASIPIAGSVAYIAAITEAMTLADAVSSVGTFNVSVNETLTLSDLVIADGIIAVSVDENLALVDVISSTAEFASTLVETLTLADTSTASLTVLGAVAESLHLADTVTISSHFSYVWQLSFENVVPPPELQGPGNPGVLKGILVYKQVYP